ncbi:MAG: hypothetical protein K940chlam8_00597 [Chlamydiae bacterium]|nr:hypothetical protein [Chlamydiota bacterium]
MASLSSSSLASSRIRDLTSAISDVSYTTHGGLFRPDYDYLMRELNTLRSGVLLSDNYKEGVLEPFIRFLEGLKEGNQFDRIFNEEGFRSKEKKVIEEVAEALLQRNHQHRYYSSSFKDLQAFQAVVTTVYESSRRSSISKLAQTTLAPLAKWGESKGPVTFPITSTKVLPGINAGIVNLPPEYRTGGLLAWASLGHEVGGHNFLRSIPGTESNHTPGIIKELQEIIYASVKTHCTEGTEKLAEYWSVCAEEAASDVLGVMSIGPAFGIGLVGFFKGKRNGRLSVSGPLHSKNKSPKKLLKFSITSSNVFVEEISDDITFKREAGLFGYRQTPREGPETKEPMNYEKVFFSTGKHPVDVLRLFVIIRVIRLFIERIGKHITELHEEHTEHRGHTEHSIKLLEIRTEDAEHTEYSIEVLKKHIEHIEHEYTERRDFLEGIIREWYEWIRIIDSEVEKDLEGLKEISFEELHSISPPTTQPFKIPIALARKTAQVTAEAIALKPLQNLDEKCLMDVISWKVEDERIVDEIRKAIKDEECTKLPRLSYKEKDYARHIIAASILESLETSSNPYKIEMIFNKMKVYLIDAYSKISNRV